MVRSSNENDSAFGSQSHGNVTTSHDGVAPLKERLQKPCQTTDEQQITTENKKYKNMKKQTIRQMIAEAINELDWKTYANAAKKRKEQGNEKNAHELSLYAGKQFQKQHDLPNLEKTNNTTHNMYPMDDYAYINGDDAYIYM